MSDDIEPTRYKLKRAEESVILEREDGTDLKYTLKCMDGLDRDSYMSLVTSKMTYGPNGKAQGLKDVSGLQTALLVRSLFDSAGNKVAKKDIESFPATVVEALFHKAQRLSGLLDDGVRSAKNA